MKTQYFMRVLILMIFSFGTLKVKCTEKTFAAYEGWQVTYTPQQLITQCRLVGTGTRYVNNKPQTNPVKTFLVSYSKQTAPPVKLVYNLTYRPRAGTHITLSFGSTVFILQIPVELGLDGAIETYDENFIQALIATAQTNERLTIRGTNEKGDSIDDVFSLQGFRDGLRGLQRICAIKKAGLSLNSRSISLNDAIPAFSNAQTQQPTASGSKPAIKVDVQKVVDSIVFDVARTNWLPSRKSRQLSQDQGTQT